MPDPAIRSNALVRRRLGSADGNWPSERKATAKAAESHHREGLIVTHVQNGNMACNAGDLSRSNG